MARYIHNNPVKAGLSTSPEEFNWSSYNLYAGKTFANKDIVDTDVILGLFSTNMQIAKESFIRFSRQTNDSQFTFIGLETDTTNAVDKAKQYIQDVLPTGEVNIRTNRAIREKLIQKFSSDFSLTVREIAEILNISKSVVHRSLIAADEKAKAP